MTAFRCPRCGGYISFDPGLQTVVCSYCGSELTPDEINAGLEEEGYYLANEQVCPQCGATLLTTDNTVATFCSYCGSSVVLDSTVRAEKRPDGIIPFSVKKPRCLEIWKEKLDDTLLAPDWMKDDNLTSRFRGIYMPFYVYGYRSEGGTWHGTGSYTRTEGDYDVTRTYMFDADPVINYNDMAVDASAAFPDSMSRGISPFNEKKEKEFSPAYLSGFYADASDVEPSVYSNQFQKLTESHLQNTSFKAGNLEVEGVDVMKDRPLQEEVRKVFYPVWLLNMRKKDKVSYAAINGENGKMAVDLPMDFGKYLMVSVTVAAAFYLIFNLLFTFTPATLAILSTLLCAAALITADAQMNRLYRREKHFDDLGFLSVSEPEKLEDAVTVTSPRPARKKKAVSTVLGIFGVMFACFFFVFIGGIISAFTDALLGVSIFSLISFFFPFLMVLAVVVIVSSVRVARVKVAKAPLWRKFLILLLPLLGILSNFGMFLWRPVNDDWYYVSVIFSILMIILSYLLIVNMQNRETQRDIPVFTGKRGESSEQ